MKLEKVLGKLDEATSIEDVEAVLKDVAKTEGLTEDERAKIAQAAERRLEDLVKDDTPLAGSLDETIDQAGRQVVEDLREEKARKPNVSVVVRDLSERFDIPAGFILEFVDARTGRSHPYVTKEGLYFKLSRKGFRSVQARLVNEDKEKGLYEFEAAIYPKLSRADYELLAQAKEMGDRALFREVFEELTRPTIQRGSASPVTLKEKQRKWAREIAETRATLRAVRVYTGCGLYMEEEVREP